MLSLSKLYYYSEAIILYEKYMTINLEAQLSLSIALSFYSSVAISIVVMLP